MTDPWSGRPFVKICGITNLRDAQTAADSGAAILGVVLSRLSPRSGTPSLVRQMSSMGIPVATVHTDMQSALSSDAGEDYVQLHFLHAAREIASIKESGGKKVISVVRGNDLGIAIDEARNMLDRGADLSLVDTVSPAASLVNGNGVTISDRRIGIAGKIRIEDLGVIRKLNPGFIDVSSSLEVFPGKKDRTKVIRFMEAFFSGQRTFPQDP